MQCMIVFDPKTTRYTNVGLFWATVLFSAGLLLFLIIGGHYVFFTQLCLAFVWHWEVLVLLGFDKIFEGL
jgi:hypothetical protein